MARAAQLPRQPGEQQERMRVAVQRNLDSIETRIEKLEERVAVLEARDAWFRATFYPYLQGLAAAVPHALPPTLPR